MGQFSKLVEVDLFLFLLSILFLFLKVVFFQFCSLETCLYVFVQLQTLLGAFHDVSLQLLNFGLLTLAVVSNPSKLRSVKLDLLGIMVKEIIGVAVCSLHMQIHRSSSQEQLLLHFIVAIGLSLL